MTRKSVILLLVTIASAIGVQAQNKQFLQKPPVLADIDNVVIDDKPVLIGIMSQPKSKLNFQNFPEEQYVLQINRELIESSGMVRAVPIYFDMPEDDLIMLLDKIDGVHFTGGGLTLFNFTTGLWHPYYQTAKRIFDYATKGKNGTNTTTGQQRKFLLTGICQGFELLATLAAEDDENLLRVLAREDVERPVTWQWNTTDEIKLNSKIFANFEPSLIYAMTVQEITFHYHTYGVSLGDYNSIPALNNFFKLVSTDTAENGQAYITGIEGYDHPVYALMYHPEYQMIDFLTTKTWDTIRNKETLDIFEHVARFIYEQALHVRTINAAQFGQNEAAFHDELMLESLDQLWGTVETYRIESEISIEAYALPPRIPLTKTI